MSKELVIQRLAILASTNVLDSKYVEALDEAIRLLNNEPQVWQDNKLILRSHKFRSKHCAKVKKDKFDWE